jgi:hypothetical protein
MLAPGCSMMVEDPVFSGDKSKNIPYFIQHPVSRGKLKQSLTIQKLGIKFKVLLYIDR